jgi:hypothetical protein
MSGKCDPSNWTTVSGSTEGRAGVVTVVVALRTDDAVVGRKFGSDLMLVAE